MEGPGGYQLIGRRCQVWNTFKTTASFLPGSPGLCVFSIRFVFIPFLAKNLLAARDASLMESSNRGENVDFNLKQYHAFLDSIQTEQPVLIRIRKPAFDAAQRQAAGQGVIIEPPDAPPEEVSMKQLPKDAKPQLPRLPQCLSDCRGQGQRVEAGQKLVVLDAMKTEW